MKRTKLSLLLLLSAMLLTGCRTTDPKDPNIASVYESYKSNGGTLDYNTWLNSIKGKDGTSLRTGKGAPASSIGNDGDSYIDTDSWDYYVKENGLWTKKGNIKGADGKNTVTNPDTAFTVTFDADGGMMPQGSTTSISVKWGNCITLPEPSKAGVFFDGWYTSEGKKWYSTDAVFSDLKLKARWLNATGKETYQFGSYPQSKVTDTTVTAKLDALAGTPTSHPEDVSWKSFQYYASGVVTSSNIYVDVTYADEKYRGIYINSYRPAYTKSDSTSDNSYQDDNGYSLSTVYWFKYEPITWDILTVDWKNSKALLFSHTLLDSMDYYYSYADRTANSKTIYSNNYEYSHIRYWLNGYASDSYVDNSYSFYDTAFCDTEKAKILTTTVDNSAESTGFDPNPYACEDTSDKLFLLSFSEIDNSRLGLDSDWNRNKYGSDYAKSQGIRDGYYYYWLRSPDANGRSAMSVDAGGGLHGWSDVSEANSGVSPALWVNL